MRDLVKRKPKFFSWRDLGGHRSVGTSVEAPNPFLACHTIGLRVFFLVESAVDLGVAFRFARQVGVDAFGVELSSSIKAASWFLREVEVVER